MNYRFNKRKDLQHGDAIIVTWHCGTNGFNFFLPISQHLIIGIHIRFAAFYIPYDGQRILIYFKERLSQMSSESAILEMTLVASAGRNLSRSLGGFVEFKYAAGKSHPHGPCVKWEQLRIDGDIQLRNYYQHCLGLCDPDYWQDL